MSGKKILTFYPHNFYEMSAGTHRKYYDLMTYLKARGFRTDLVSLNGFTNRWEDKDINRKEHFETIDVCEWSPGYMERWKLANSGKTGRLMDLAITGLRQKFGRLARSRSYDYVIISYAYWAKLLDEVPKSVTRIYNFQDNLTLNCFLASKKKEFNLGRMFEDEVRAVARFQYSLCISEEEALTFSPFCPDTKFITVPISFPQRFAPVGGKKFDILFIGSDNPFNRDGIAWFMEKVYPLLDKKIKIAVIGKVTQFVEKLDNVLLIPFAENLDDLYNYSKIVICPLKGGTGLKIKVIEALSYGLPVVTTTWGLSGMRIKDDNGCLLADDHVDFAKAIQTIIYDEDKYNYYKKQAEIFFDKHYSTEVVYRNLDTVFRPNELKT